MRCKACNNYFNPDYKRKKGKIIFEDLCPRCCSSVKDMTVDIFDNDLIDRLKRSVAEEED